MTLSKRDFMQNIKPEAFNRYYHLSSKHFNRLNRAADILKSKDLQKDEYIDFVDVLTSRFQSLQSVIAEKLLPTILELLGEEVSNRPFIEIYERAIKLNIVNLEYSEWIELRKERNIISHGDYDELELPELKEVIKDFIEYEVDKIIALFLHIKDYISKNKILSNLIKE
jgi:hypothetical protein